MGKNISEKKYQIILIDFNISRGRGRRRGKSIFTDQQVSIFGREKVCALAAMYS
jgi:hypothetical protein